VLMRALLAAGSKSPTHLNVALERYATSLRELIGRAGLFGQMIAVELAAQFYAALPQKVLMVLDRLLALGLIGAEAVAIWAFESAIPATLSEQASASSAWEVLNYALERAAARLPEAEEKISKALGDLDLVHNKARTQQERANNLASQLRAYAQARR
ncbi:armadillo-type protein, partial [Dunaliella salina]